jgi:hypothetical protein
MDGSVLALVFSVLASDRSVLVIAFTFLPSAFQAE